MSQTLTPLKAPGLRPTVSVAPLAPEQLRLRCDADSFAFETTRDLKAVETLVGQDRALAAIEFGVSINQPGYNIFALGSDGTGRHSPCHSFLRTKAEKQDAPDDWVYEHNFHEAHKPRAIRLPAGVAVKFRDAMSELVDDLRVAIPEAFDSDDYREKLHELQREFEDVQASQFRELEDEATKRDIALVRTRPG